MKRDQIKETDQFKNNPQICYISDKKPKLRWDGKPIYSIKGVKFYEKPPISSKYLDEPIYRKTCEEVGTFKNPLVNTDDCNPDFLLALADRLQNKDIPFPEVIREKTIANINDLFINNKTPRMFYEEVSEYANVIFKDDNEPETYRLSPNFFFKNFSKRQFLAFDVHDLLQHPLQLKAWPKQFEYVTLAAYLASELTGKKVTTLKSKMLTTFVWFVCFEESLITIDGHLTSFGCLNFLAPSETPFNTLENFRNCDIETQKIGFKWHYLDALKELYKLEKKYSKKLNKNLYWMKKFGYDVDDNLRELIQSENSKPFENLDFHEILKYKITTPKSPEELFENGIKLLREEL